LPPVSIQLAFACWLPTFTVSVKGTTENLVLVEADWVPIIESMSLFAASLADCIFDLPPALEAIEPELSMTSAIS
jgi:hypothetical protein